MGTNEETLALQRPQQPDEFLALIEKVVLNPDVDAEKLKVIVGLKLQLEDRAAEKAFDAAMQEAQKEVLTLRWDKVNPEKNSRHVSFPKIDEMLKPIREKYGFSESFGVEPELPAPNLMMMYCDVTHKDKKGSHRRRFHLPMSISGEGPKGGGVMTGQQAVVSGTSYGMRGLEKLVWKIPMLVDKDDNDGNTVRLKVNDAEQANLKKMMKGFSEERIAWLLGQFNISELSELPRSKYNNAIDRINAAIKKDAERGTGEQSKADNKEHWSKSATVNQDQEATLQALIDEVGGTCSQEFLKAHKIDKLSSLPASAYQGALKALDAQRRAM